MKNILSFFIVLILFTNIESYSQNKSFVKVENGKFIRDGEQYRYVGTNFWYGSILGSTGEGGDRNRLIQELDSLKSIGIDNLRILVGSDGENGVPTKVEPTLQKAPGVYNDTILDGLDYLLFEMNKRDMLAVLYINNSWEWSGGYGQYLEWAGMGKAPIPAIDGYEKYMKFVSQFSTCEKAQNYYYDHLKFIIGRVNRYTNKRYIDDSTIMSWQIGNEPRAFSNDAKPAFAKWLSKASSIIRSLDKNHLISTGNEGKAGCEEDMNLFETINADKNVDYITIHMWPYNWGWVKADSLYEMLPQAKVKTKEYIETHLSIADKYNKPVVMEEFGYPRDDFKFAKGSSTKARDEFYKYVFGLIANKSENYRHFAGCNFWAWGGMARQSDKNIFWKKGDDYMGDPAQEQQGLNSVFLGDSTIKIIKESTKLINDNDDIIK